MATAPKTTVKKLFYWQIVALFLLMALFSIKGSLAVVSVIVGCLLAAIPTTIFVRQAFRFGGAKQAQTVLRSFYWGEALKLISCTLGFALVFKFATEIDLVALWVGFCLQLPIPIVLAATGQLKPTIVTTTTVTPTVPRSTAPSTTTNL